MSELSDTLYTERLDAALRARVPEVDQLSGLLQASFKQEDLKKLTIAARAPEWREALREAGFLAAVADCLTVDLDLGTAHEAIRFLTNELAYNDESRLLMLQSGRMVKLSRWLQVGVTAHTACLCFHNLFNTDEDGEAADRSVTFETRCSAIAQGILQQFCQITLQRAETDNPINWSDWAAMCSYLLECAVDHQPSHNSQPPMFGATEDLITGFEGLDLLAPPVSTDCRCGRLDGPLLGLLCDLLVVCGKFTEHPILQVEKLGTSHYHASDQLVEALEDNSVAAAELFDSILEFLERHHEGLSRIPEWPLQLLKSHNTMVKEVYLSHAVKLGDAYADDISYSRKRQERRLTQQDEDGDDKQDEKVIVPEPGFIGRIDKGLPSFRERRHRISDMIGNRVQAMRIEGRTLMINPTFQSAVFGLGSGLSDIVEMSCVVLANMANNESAARAMVYEHRVHQVVYDNAVLIIWNSEDLLYAASALLRHLAVSESHCITYRSPGEHPRVTRPCDWVPGLQTLLDHKSTKVQENGFRLLRLMCRNSENVAWSLLGLQRQQDDRFEKTLQGYHFQHVLMNADKTASNTILIGAAGAIGEVYKHISKVSEKAPGANLLALKETHTFEDPLYIRTMIDVCKLDTLDAAKIWLGLGLMTKLSELGARAVYNVLKDQWEYLRGLVATAEAGMEATAPFVQRQTNDASAITAANGQDEQAARNAIAKHNANITQVVSARNALYLAQSLRDQLESELDQQHLADIQTWIGGRSDSFSAPYSGRS